MGHASQSRKPGTQIFQDIFNASPIGIAVENFDGQPLFVNPAFCSFLDFSEEELRHKHCVDFSPREDAEKDWTLFQQLKAGSIDHYQLEKRYFRRDGSLVWGRLSISLLNIHPSPLVIAMVEDITDQKQIEEARQEAEQALRESEERLRLAQWAAHIGTFEVNLRTGVDIWQPETEALYGLPPGGFSGTLTAFENLIHPDDRERVTNLTQEMMRTGQPAEEEWRVVWPDGSVHWIASRGQVFMDESGQPSRMLGINMDITERKRAEQDVAEMTRRLIAAQEQERIRIARELHDDIAQRLALLAVELGQIQQCLPASVAKHRARMGALSQRTTEISTDVQSMSHQLHSSKLEYLGIAVAMKSFCKEFSDQQKVEIDFTSGGLPNRLSPETSETSLCLFRVLQEALHNSAKHSGVRHFDVQLRGDSREIYLKISDAGQGFELEAAMQGHGLGLISMRERVRLVNGTIAINSKPMGGTTILVRVPLGLKEHSKAV
jgi:PAS domain S-box-containing protein